MEWRTALKPELDDEEDVMEASLQEYALYLLAAVDKARMKHVVTKAVAVAEKPANLDLERLRDGDLLDVLSEMHRSVRQVICC